MGHNCRESVGAGRLQRHPFIPTLRLAPLSGVTPRRWSGEVRRGKERWERLAWGHWRVPGYCRRLSEEGSFPVGQVEGLRWGQVEGLRLGGRGAGEISWCVDARSGGVDQLLASSLATGRKFKRMIHLATSER
eukprot:141120-Rhodomonas_salina.3